MTDEDDHRALTPVGSRRNVDEEADSIIAKHIGLAMGGGAIPVPLLDLAAVTAVQLEMLKRLAATYETPFDAGSARAFVVSLTAALGSGALARIGASLAKTLPGIGTLGGGLAQIALTGAATYAIGQLFKRVLREGRPVDTLSIDDVRDEAAGHLEAGRERARSVLSSFATVDTDDR